MNKVSVAWFVVLVFWNKILSSEDNNEDNDGLEDTHYRKVLHHFARNDVLVAWMRWPLQQVLLRRLSGES